MLMQQFEQLNEKTQNAVLSLHSEKSNSNNLQEKLNDILDCNGIEVVPVNSVALYLTIPRSEPLKDFNRKDIIKVNFACSGLITRVAPTWCGAGWRAATT